MEFFLDHCVPASVETMLIEAGHTVIWVKDTLPTDAPDPIVALAAELSGAILVSMDRDFDQIAPRIPRGQRTRFRRLSRICLLCKAPRSAERLKAALSLIELECRVAAASADKRMIVWINDSYIRTQR
jgi:hypothetical protein